jgi:hypothetical protein
MTREQFFVQQTHMLDRIFSLTKDERESRSRFEQLTLDSFDFLASQQVNVFHAFSPWPESAFSLLKCKNFREQVSPSLLRRWEDWTKEYYEIAERNPSLELRDLMQDISESHNASSWPYGLERRIQIWLDAGDPITPPPFHDRRGIVTPDFFHRLRELRRRCGGWLYWNDELKRVVFAQESEWQKVQAAQEAAEEKWQRDWRESKDKANRREKQLARILASACNDTRFWSDLKSWELAREDKRPCELPQVTALSGPVRIQLKAKSREQKIADRIPAVDAIFTDFIVRTRSVDDVLTEQEIVLFLRSYVRNELGLDGVLSWAGGPGIGNA